MGIYLKFAVFPHAFHRSGFLDFEQFLSGVGWMSYTAFIRKSFFFGSPVSCLIRQYIFLWYFLIWSMHLILIVQQLNLDSRSFCYGEFLWSLYCFCFLGSLLLWMTIYTSAASCYSINHLFHLKRLFCIFSSIFDVPFPSSYDGWLGGFYKWVSKEAQHLNESCLINLKLLNR